MTDFCENTLEDISQIMKRAEHAAKRAEQLAESIKPEAQKALRQELSEIHALKAEYKSLIQDVVKALHQVEDLPKHLMARIARAQLDAAQRTEVDQKVGQFMVEFWLKVQRDIVEQDPDGND